MPSNRNVGDPDDATDAHKRTYARLLALHDFKLLFLAAAVSFAGNIFTSVALAFGILAVTHSVTAIGVVLAARQVGQVIFLLIGGAYGDRAIRSRIIATGFFVSAFTQGTLAFFLMAEVRMVWTFASVAFINGAAMAFLGPAWTGAIPDAVPQDLLRQANALFSMTRNALNIGGAVMAGIFVASVGAGWALAVDAASFVVGAVLALHVSHETLISRKNTLLRDIRDGWAEFRSRPWLIASTAQYALYNMAFIAAFSVYGPAEAHLHLGGPHAYGEMVATFGIGSLAGAVLAGRSKPQRPMVNATVITLGSVPAVALLALHAKLPIVLLGMAASGVSIEAFAVLWDTILQTHVPSDTLSRVSSFDSLGSFVLTPVGTACAGPLALALGSIERGLWLTALLMIIPTIAVLCVPDVWRLSNRAFGSGSPDGLPESLV